ncbi:MAG: CDP-glycerol glycerophosphotransferase family protein [Ruminococcus flavefaciens]|nr:CDP-glycerol glycerophosphotransferase family protein [Ruminococcus flavefaciens]
MSITRNKKIWIFNAGQSFSGNPKWLFEYIIHHHKEIRTVWMCYDNTTEKYVKKLGHEAYLYDSHSGKKIMQSAGVYVVEMCKEIFQEELSGIVILNLWHGVGCKSIERKVTSGFLQERIAKKYIQNNDMLRNNQLFLVTSELMEKHFKEQCGIDDDKVIRAGYPRCVVNDNIETYDHDILKKKGLDNQTKIAVYAPTYRDNARENFIKTAIPDWIELIKTLKNEKILLILKMHPLVEKDFQYLMIKETYQNCPNLLFWDNSNDIYEIFDKIDIAIVDYSSMFYDFLERGVSCFIRYFFDINNSENFRDFVYDVKEMTCGRIANNFTELLQALSSVGKENIEEKQRIHNLFWSYSTEDSCERIIKQTMQFLPEKRIFPKLYSFDIFDTLISRKCMYPTTVFCYVQDKMRTSADQYPLYLMKDFSTIRRWCEANVREFYKKSVALRKDERLEIQLYEIYDRMAELYHLSKRQKEQLMAWEIEGELSVTIPVQENIAWLKQLRSEGNEVVLISDMYLPKDVVQQLLIKADPILGEIPLYLSSDIGHQKTTRKLFLHVYADLDYHYSQWIHVGDNKFADQIQPSHLGIETISVDVPEWNDYELRMSHYSNNPDFRSIVKKFMTWRQEGHTPKEQFVYCYASLYLVPYVNWALQHAIQQEYETLYFISRDGHYLKIIADEIISIKKLHIKTKYIYGSRKAWRLPSFIETVDDDFFEIHGNLGGIQSFNKLLAALNITEELFDKFFPELDYIKQEKRYSRVFMEEVCGILKKSNDYQKYLLHIAEKERKIVIDYLRQEIDFSEKFAFVEYWGRGYTQDCLARLLNATADKEIKTPMYYVRSIYPTIGNSIRYNYTCNTHPLVFVESLFANLPYKTIAHYAYDNNHHVIPVKESCDNDTEMHEAIEKYLVQFCQDYFQLVSDEDYVGRLLYDFSMSYFRNDTKDPLILEIFTSLKDAVGLGEQAEEYAPPITFRTIKDWFNGKSFRTKNIELSMRKSSFLFRSIYRSYCFYCNNIRDGWRRKRGKKIY